MKTVFLLLTVMFFSTGVFSQPNPLFSDSEHIIFNDDDDRWTHFPYNSSAVNYNVHAIAVDGSNVYVGGEFTQAGTNPANHVAMWDGTEWHALGEGVNGNVYAITVYEGDVYVAGDFTQAGNRRANRIARWDGENWHALGPGFDRPVRALVHSADGIYAGGEFGARHNEHDSNIARWDGENWNFVANGFGTIYALAFMNDELYAGGSFSGLELNRIARLDGDSWVPLDNGLNDVVYTLHADGSSLYVGGRFTQAGGANSNRVARWDGEEWHRYTQSLGASDVRAIVTYDDVLYIGGDIGFAGGGWFNHFARWDGEAWEPVGNGMNSRILAMAATNDGFVAGGWFTTGSHFVSRFDGSDWQPMNSGTASGLIGIYNGAVRELTEYNGSIYVAGRLFGAADLMTNGIARWDGERWHALGYALNDEAGALQVHDGDLYVGGHFTWVNNESMGGIARWDGEQWHRVGESSPRSLSALASWKGDLYAGGGFARFGGNTYNNIARWDGEEWHELNGGLPSGRVHVLLATDDYLYAGGDFTGAGGEPANRLARWDGEEWEPIDNDFNHIISALAVYDGELYAGGYFTEPFTFIARWDGSQWHDVAGGTNNRVAAFQIVDDDLYVGGQFFEAGGVSALTAARWDGEQYHPLGSGLGRAVLDFLLLDDKLYLGGIFIQAGGKPSNLLAIWNTGDIVEPARVMPAEPANGATDVDPGTVLSWNPINLATSYDLQISTDAAFQNIISPVEGITGTSVNFSTDPLPSNTQLWWRVRANVDGTSGGWSDSWTFTTSTLTSLTPDMELPRQLTLGQNYPNPFNPTTVIRFGLPEQGDVRLNVYSLTGQRVARLAGGNLAAGWHQITFDASGLSSGIYFYRLQSPDGTITKKLTLIK